MNKIVEEPKKHEAASIPESEELSGLDKENRILFIIGSVAFLVITTISLVFLLIMVL